MVITPWEMRIKKIESKFSIILYYKFMFFYLNCKQIICLSKNCYCALVYLKYVFTYINLWFIDWLMNRKKRQGLELGYGNWVSFWCSIGSKWIKTKLTFLKNDCSSNISLGWYRHQSRRPAAFQTEWSIKILLSAIVVFHI